MIHVLIYDIESDKIRTKVAQACENYGLERVQFSAFWGEISDNQCEELLLKCQELIGDEPARVHILPLCRQCFSRRRHFATGAFEGINEAPRERNEPILFLPDAPGESPSVPRSRRNSRGKHERVPEDQKHPGPTRHPRDRPPGTTEDPWADMDAEEDAHVAR